MAKLKTVLYGRTSLDKSEGRSVDEQLRELRRWAEREDVEVVAVLRDDGVSASRYAKGKTRPAWQQVQDLILAGQVEALAVWEISRATRDLVVWAALKAALMDAGAKFVVQGKVHDPSDPDDGFMLDLQAAQGTRESALISKRTLRGKRAGAAAGRPSGRVNYGHQIIYDPATGKPLKRVEHPQQAPIVREVARRFLGGESGSSIVRDLTKRNIEPPGGGRWHPRNLLITVAAPALAGLREHHGDVKPSEHLPAVVDLETHHRLVALLADPSRRSIRTGEHIKHLLVGVAKCGVCGGRIRTVSKQRKTGRHVNYSCAQCFGVSVRAELVDAMITGRVLAFLRRPDVLGELTPDDGPAQEATARIAELKAELTRARGLHKERKLSLDSLVAMEAWAVPELKQLEVAARPKNIPSRVFDIAGKDAVRRWKDTPLAVQRQIVAALFDVTISPGGRRNQHSPFDPDRIVVERR